VKRAREDALAEAAKKHAEELKKVRDEVARLHADDVAKLKSDHQTMILKRQEEAASPDKAVSAKPRDGKRGKNDKPDDLKLIWGVGPEIEKLLHKHGVTRFAEIAGWTAKDLAWLDTILPNFKGRAESEKWVEQAKRLASGWRPEREIGDRPDGLEILKGPRNGKPDDLKLIWGVGSKLEKVLNDAGFYHFDQLAKWTDKQLSWVDSQLGEFAGRAEREEWIAQAKKLAAGWRPSKDTGDKPG
jgi:predicted flap endonuclease-1-like 5' DNA nuclease